MNNNKANGAPVKTATAPTPAPAKEEQKPTIPTPEPKPDPLAERVSKITGLKKKTELLDTYRQTQKNLSEFVLGNDKRKDMLTISDGEDNEFETSNSEVIQDVVNLLKAKVGAKIINTETELLETVL